MEIAVTGATGYLGTALSADLEARGHAVTRFSSANCDLTRAESLSRWSDRRFDRIFHLAAWTQAGDFCLYHPGEQWIRNQQINTNVLAWWQQSQPQAKLVAIGTSCAYDPELPLSEENYLNGRPIESLFTYAMTKRMLYTGMLALSRQYGLRYLHLVPSTLYGPGYPADGRQMHFIFDLIRKVLRGRLYGEPVVFWGDGQQRRELIYRDDFVRLAAELADRVDDDTVNLGAGEEHTLRHFAAVVCEMAGYPFERVQWDTSRYVGARSKCLETGKLRRLVPDLRLMPLAEGLRRAIDWFEAGKERLLPPATAGAAP